MPLLDHLFSHGSIFAALLTLYLLAIMRFTSPRVWAFADYPKEITDAVEPQTSDERRLGAIIGIPFFVLMLGFPVISTLMLESTYIGPIPLIDAFLNVFGLALFGTAADLFILDWLIVGTITPDFVIIPGTEHMRDKEYKDFRVYHGKAHIRGTIGLAILSLIIAAVIVMF